jgi:hypothetical protein
MCDLRLILSPPHGKRRFLRTINKSGIIFRPLSRLTGRVFFNSYTTWSYWGFEAVIWARENKIICKLLRRV